MIDIPPPNYEHTIQAVMHCAIPRENIRISYENDFQSDVVTISDIGKVEDDRLRCLRAAVHPFYILMLEKPAQQAAFDAFSARENRPREKAAARDWLRSQGMLEHLPEFDPVQKIEYFAAEIETACGLPVGTALTARDSSTLIVVPTFLQGRNFEKSAKTLGCVTRMYAASDAYEHNVRLFFIGNGAFRESDQK